MKKLLSVILVLACIFSFAFAEETEHTVLMTLDGQPVYLDIVQSYASMLYENGYTASETDLLDALEYVLRYEIGVGLLVSDPSAVLGDEAYTSLVTEAGEYYDSAINEFVNYYAAEGASDDDLAALALDAVEYYGITRDEYISTTALQTAYEALLTSFDVTVTEEEVLTSYEAEANYEMASVGSALMYEYYTNYYGYSFYFMPEGYRGIIHILLLADDDLCTAYSSASTDDELAAAAAAMIASKQDVIDEIYAKFNAGTPFADLIKEYNEDPGMTDETNLTEGYAVHPESIMWMSEFTEGAFSDKMQQPGDISDPVCTSYGIHILYYLRDIPGGVLPITDEVYETIYAYLIQDKQIECADALLKGYEVVYTDAYNEYVGKDNFLMK